VLLCEESHVEVPAICPDGGGIDSDGGREAQSGRAIWEGASGSEATLGLAVEAFEAIVRADARPVFFGKGEVACSGEESVLEAFECLWGLTSEPCGEGCSRSASDSRA
jgi:hypothetical protein